MSEQEQMDTDAAAVAEQEPPADGDTQGAEANGGNTPEFADLGARTPAVGGQFELQRFGGVQVVLTAELGRTQVTIQELMGLSEGAILELNREISAPVELVAQGVPLGNGEVVVVDGRFAIRIKQIYQV